MKKVSTKTFLPFILSLFLVTTTLLSCSNDTTEPLDTSETNSDFDEVAFNSDPNVLETSKLYDEHFQTIVQALENNGISAEELETLYNTNNEEGLRKAFYSSNNEIVKSFELLQTSINKVVEKYPSIAEGNSVVTNAQTDFSMFYTSNPSRRGCGKGYSGCNLAATTVYVACVTAAGATADPVLLAVCVVQHRVAESTCQRAYC